MIRRTLTTLFCAALFLVLATSVQAEHITGAPYFCTTIESAMETVRLQKAEKMDELRDRAMSDVNFKCWFDDFNTRFYPVELLHQYKSFGTDRGMIRALAPDGTEVFLFGTMPYVDSILHARGA